MSRAEHLIENALISVTHQEDIESYIAGEISCGNAIDKDRDWLEMVYEMAEYVIYTWGKE